jgi:hypothetical protein
MIGRKDLSWKSPPALCCIPVTPTTCRRILLQIFQTVFLAMRMNVFLSYQSYAHVEASPSACLFETMFDGMVASLLPVFLSTSMIFSIVFLF